MLELRSIAKTLGDFTVRRLDLRVGQGAYFVLLGPSGVGKTVLLEIVAGLMRPDSGSVLWRGVDVTRHPPEKRPFGIVYQDYALFPHLT
ncbi:MAG: ATP-binding cassette domain-containing protein, partial [Phycisphaerae bacterium]